MLPRDTDLERPELERIKSSVPRRRPMCRDSHLVRQAWKLRPELARQGAVPTPLEDESPAAKVDAQEANADAPDEKNHADD